MELVDESPDSEDTMALVAEKLLEEFGNTQDGWVMSVGNDKIYQHLENIKRIYGDKLRRLFPGDWHILKNFQPVIMNITMLG